MSQGYRRCGSCRMLQPDAGAQTAARANSIPSEHFVIPARAFVRAELLDRYIKRISRTCSMARPHLRFRRIVIRQHGPGLKRVRRAHRTGNDYPWTALLGPMSKICHSRNWRQHGTHLPSRWLRRFFTCVTHATCLTICLAGGLVQFAAGLLKAEWTSADLVDRSPLMLATVMWAHAIIVAVMLIVAAYL